MTDISPQENGFETVFRDSKDGLAIIKNEVFVDCNQSMLDIVGADSRDQFVGFTPFDFSPEMQPDGRSSYEKGMAMISECLENGSVRFEWMHRKLNDQMFWVEVIITKMVLDGEVVLHTNWRDISKKKELELETQAQKVAFETLFNESEDGLCLLTAEAYFDCNKAFTHMFGAEEKSEIIGISPIDIYPEFQPDGRRSDEKAAEIIKTAFTQNTIRFEWMHKKFDGTEFWCEIVLFRITLNDRDVLYASTRDISEKKTLQLEIAKQKDSFEQLFKESKDGLSIIADGAFYDCNNSFVELFGYDSVEDIVGLTPFEVSAPFQEDGEAVEIAAPKRIASAFTEGNARFEWNHLRKDGSTFWGEVILTRIVKDGREVLYGITRDMSAKRALQEEIAEQKETFETLFNESEDGLCLLTTESYFDCNKAFTSLFGAHDKEEIIGITPVDISPEFQPDGRASTEKAAEIIDTAFTKGTIRFEWVHKKFDGTEFWCEIILFKINLSGRDVLYAITRDISEKKALQLEINAQKATFETLFNESHDSLSLISDGHFIDCNTTFLKTFGFSSKEQVVGLTPLDISPEYQEEGVSTIDRAEAEIGFAFTNGSARFEWLHKRADGVEFWCEVILTKIKLNDQDVLYAITRDISEKKKLEMEIIERNKELRSSNNNLEDTIENLKLTQNKLVESEKMASLGSLVAGVAHEINTPVGIGLTGVTQLKDECVSIKKCYEEGMLDEDNFNDFLGRLTEISDIVNKNLERTAHLVRSFKQVAVDQTSEEDRQVNIKDYFEEVVFSLASVLRKASAEVTIDCDDGYNVLANPGLLSQVLTNLIVNSVKHGFSGRKSGAIKIHIAEINETEFVMTYQDDGKGISAANAPKIFDPFFTTGRDSGGTGLGLNITYNIVTNALGGSIVCNSREGEGAEFVIQFKVSARL